MKLAHLCFLLFSAFLGFTWAGQSSSTPSEPANQKPTPPKETTPAKKTEEATKTAQSPDSKGQNPNTQIANGHVKQPQQNGHIPNGTAAPANGKPNQTKSQDDDDESDSDEENGQEKSSFLTSGLLAVILMPLFTLL